MAVQLQWVDKSRQWKYTYLQGTGSRNFGTRGKNSLLVEGMTIFTTLLQVTYIDGREWLPVLGRTKIRVVEYNHLLQRGSVNPIRLPGRVLPWPRDRIFEENTERLKSLVPRDWPKYPKMGHGRKNCDLCLSLATVSIEPSPVLSGGC